MSTDTTTHDDHDTGDDAPHVPTAPPQGIAALRAMRSARRAHRLGDTDWYEVAYRVYLTAFGSLVAALFAVGAVGDKPLGESGRAELLARGPAYIGLFASLAVAAGLRSGSRGGPVALQPPDVRHVLLAPLDRRQVLGPLAFRQLRHAAFMGAVAGGILGLLMQRRLEGNRWEWAAFGAAAGVTIAVLGVAVALVACGIRLPRPVATFAALAVIAGAAADIGRWIAWPTTAIGSLALWPARNTGLAFVPPAVAVVLAVVGVLLAHRVRVEDAERRTALAGQLRFAVTTRDLRTVMVLHRLLAQDLPRQRPWFKVPSRPVSPTWRRSWQSVARFPLPRLVRILALGAVAGLAYGGMFRGATPLALVGALAMMIVALDLLEPLAQARDQLDATALLPVKRSQLYARLVTVPAILAVLVGAVGIAAVAPFAHGSELALAAIVLPCASLAGLAGAIPLITREERTDTLDGALLPPEVAGTREVLRTVFPLAIALTGCIPVLLARTARRLGDPIIPRAAQGVVWPLLVSGLVLAWVHRYEEIKAWQKRSMEQARANSGAARS